ncbi:conserved phage C-terminal domain-containing protein [Clostridium ihumii]|uniref:conserved phage C-terminal domain-containing protein n=1 Tax=Clostridium ihumii TaxID=1470356 RepID=UPI00068667C5|nr:conserved phage C-terminal domain-containing protein [Clostridium ihumii]
MKYTILGFNQKKVLDLKLTIEDLLILRYFIDFKDSGDMVSRIIDNEKYYWVKYESINEEFPILKFKKDTIYRRLKKLVELNILVHTTVKDKNGSYSFYNIGRNYKILISDSLGFKSDGGTDLNPDPYGFKSVPNNPSTNNPSTNNKYIVEIIDFFNTTCGTNYRATSKNTKKFINARLNEKFTVDNFKTVIVKKFNDWNGTEYEKYLRPETLFGTKFEMYLNQKERRNNIVATTNPTDTKYDFTPREPTDGEIPDVDF